MRVVWGVRTRSTRFANRFDWRTPRRPPKCDTGPTNAPAGRPPPRLPRPILAPILDRRFRLRRLIMLMPMGTFEWQVLRAILRAGSTYPNGRQLRLVPSRRTKDGSFLTDIVNRGLIKVVGKNKDPFEATYALTTLGEYA